MLTNLKTRLTNQPYFLFLITGAILIVATFFMVGESVDFHLHDTYFVVSINYFIWALAALFFFAWALYKLTDKFLWTKKLIWIHVSATISVLVLLSTIGFRHAKILPPITRETISYQHIIDDEKRQRVIAYPIAILFVLGQVAYFLNLIIGLIKRKL